MMPIQSRIYWSVVLSIRRTQVHSFVPYLPLIPLPLPHPLCCVTSLSFSRPQQYRKRRVSITQMSNSSPEEEQDDPILLRYVDYICSEEMMRPILQKVQEIIGIPILHLPCPSHRSGPKFDQIHEIFSESYANIGRL